MNSSEEEQKLEQMRKSFEELKQKVQQQFEVDKVSK